MHSYRSGNRDSVFYIGQCYLCNTVVTDVVSEANGLGLSGTNAGGEDDLINSVYRDNMGGSCRTRSTANCLRFDRMPTPRGTNNKVDVPTKIPARLGWGEGIVPGGSVGNIVEKNLDVNHASYGIITTMLPDENIYPAKDNSVHNSTIAGTGTGDFVLSGGGTAYIVVLAALMVISGTIERSIPNAGKSEATR